jgi:hypothetical protein
MLLKIDLEKAISEFRSSLGWVLSDLYAPLSDPMKPRGRWARLLGVMLGFFIVWAGGLYLSLWLFER